MAAASAVNASTSETAVAWWERLQSDCQRTTIPAPSSSAPISSSGVSQTVSASGMRARSGPVSGRPSSSVNANRPPAASAPEIPSSSARLSANASIVSSRSTTSNVPRGSGGTLATSKRQGRPRARARAMSIALAL